MDNPAPAMDATWLVQLEERVERAVAEIGRLRQENRRLERELLRMKKSGAAAADGGAAWERERSEVRGRVERLARRLEELLGEEAGALLAPAAGGAADVAPAAGADPDALAEAADEPQERRAARSPVQRTLEPVD